MKKKLIKKPKSITGKLKKKVAKVTKVVISKKKVKSKKPSTKVTLKKPKLKVKTNANKVKSKVIKKQIKKSIKKQIKKSVKQIKKPISELTKPVSKMSPEERKQLAQKKLPKQRKPSKKQEEKIKETRRNMLKDPILRQSLIDLAGEHALAIVQEFTYDMSDEDLSRKLKVKVSEVRSTLNKLHNKGIVTYSRSKDSETGWYSYIWKLQEHKINRIVEETINTTDTLLNSQTEHYYCSQCSSKEYIPFDEAMDLKFRCPICSMPLSYKEKQK